MQRLNLGVIGTGVIGRLHALHLASRIPTSRLVAICDINASAAAECLDRCDIETLTVFEDYHRLLADPGIEAVAVCTPGETHGEIIEAAASAGKHIFCEKPLDIDLAKADRALAAAANAGIKLQIGFNRRFDPSFKHLKDAVFAGEIGRLHRVHITSRDPVRHGEPLADLFLDTTIHDLDMVRYLTGSEVTSIYVVAARMGESGDGPDTAVLTLQLASGVIATIDNSRRSVYGYDQRIEVFGSEGGIAAGNEPPQRLRVSSRDEQTVDERVPFFVARYVDSYAAEMSAFVESVFNNGEPRVTGEDGRAALKLALAARRSYLENAPVVP